MSKRHAEDEYNRAGVEYVMDFCTKEEYKRFLEVCPEFESHVVREGITLIKFWPEVSQEEQGRRFEARIEGPLRQWKLSPMDLESYSRWYAYSRARDMMLEARAGPSCRSGTDGRRLPSGEKGRTLCQRRSAPMPS